MLRITWAEKERYSSTLVFFKKKKIKLVKLCFKNSWPERAGYIDPRHSRLRDTPDNCVVSVDINVPVIYIPQVENLGA